MNTKPAGIAPAPNSRISLRLSPASITTAAPVAASRMAVPRSGCLATSSTGAPIIPAGISSHQDSLALGADRP